MVNQTYPSFTPFHPVSVVLSRYYKATMDRGSTASYYVAFRYRRTNTNTPGAMASDKSDFSYKIRHCAHPTDTNGYRFFFPPSASLRRSFSIFITRSPNRSHVFSRSSSCNRRDLPGIIVRGRVDRSMQIKGSAHSSASAANERVNARRR